MLSASILPPAGGPISGSFEAFGKGVRSSASGNSSMKSLIIKDDISCVVYSSDRGLQRLIRTHDCRVPPVSLTLGCHATVLESFVARTNDSAFSEDWLTSGSENSATGESLPLLVPNPLQ